MKQRQPLTKKPRRATDAGHTSVPTMLASESSSDSAASEGAARHELVAVEAYFLAERRGFTPGCELDDWLAAESIVEDRLRKARPIGRG